ncbi:CenpB-DNA-bind-domain-containing protein, partial [Byssothecium circinans]
MATRSAISDAERRSLRQFYSSQKPRPTQKAMRSWFEGKYGRKPSQSTVSESLSDRYKHLDDSPLPSRAVYRTRFGKWPLLEQVLFSWQQQLQAQGSLVSGDLLAEKAREVWALLPEYASTPQPEFSQGWLSRFKSRY